MKKETREILSIFIAVVLISCIFGIFTGLLTFLSMDPDGGKCQKPKTVYGYFPPHWVARNLFCERW